MKDCTILVLAGGKSKRMKQGGIQSLKSLLVTYNQPIIVRLICQIFESNFDNVVVSTSPECHEELTVNLCEYFHQHIQSERLKVVTTEEHYNGSLAALNRVINFVNTQNCILCFGDIVYLQNPFFHFCISKECHTDYLSTADPFDSSELKHGGIVYKSGDEIDRIIERPIANPKKINVAKWSGLALFDTKDLHQYLEKFLENMGGDSPEGDLFEYRRLNGRKTRFLQCSDFINVNNVDDLLLSSLYTASRFHAQNTEIEKYLLDTASYIRKCINNKIRK